ncbi:MAG TPA: Dabb family protein [Gemmataceae bacterium]|nr:Dabb family protein [Gemmataceae bacterium]
MTQPSDRGRLLAHNVFFSLHDRSPAARARLVESSRKYLAPHAGVVFFACGELAADLRRDVNDLEFDVALHVVFTDQAAHDAYQTTPAHLQFIAENKSNWKRVRVFDSVVEQSQSQAQPR